MGFTLRRDSSANNIPVLGYQDAADAQDIILWATIQVTEIGNTDGSGDFKATNVPLVDASHRWAVDGNNIGRQRLIDGKSITAQTSGGTTLYAGQANGQTGVIPLYTDSGLSTSAANLTGVQITYWTLSPVACDSQGRLAISGDLSASLSGALPAGSNNIGHVNVDSAPALAAGSNIIGKVIPWNPLDNGGEQASIRIRDSHAGNDTAVLPYSADNKAIPTYPLSVSSMPWVYNGGKANTMDRVRNAKYFHAETFTAAGSASIWTPSGAVGIMGFMLSSNTDCDFDWSIAGGDIPPNIHLGPAIPVIVVHLPNVWIPGSTGEELGIHISNVGTPPSAGLKVGVMVWGTEE